MQGYGNRRWIAGFATVLMLLIAGCASNTPTRAPVEDRGTMSGASSAPGGLPTTDASGKPLPGIENLGKPGYYAVRPGDTIRRIGSETGQRWQDLARWNNLDNPDKIEVGQVLRVIPPIGAVAVTAPAVVPAGTVAGASQTTNPSSSAAATPAAAGASAPAKEPVTTASVGPAAAGSGDEDISWIWPAQGAVIQGFDEARNKGLDIAGQAGEPVLAAASGRVIYAGAGLPAYGNLIILQHNKTYLTAYAHNQVLLVKEGQTVQKGQKIAEMGNSAADRVKLHFEMRRQGKAVDPARYLPQK